MKRKTEKENGNKTWRIKFTKATCTFDNIQQWLQPGHHWENSLLFLL